MPIFGETVSPYDEYVEKVTAETMTTENWALMMDISDRILSLSSSSVDLRQASKQCLLSVKKRLNHRDPHVVLLALSLLDCLWNNCCPTFRQEVSSKEFINELNYKATNSNRPIAEKTRGMLKKWAENECKADSSLSLVESLYKDLLVSGYTFENSGPEKRKQQPIPSDPNIVTSDLEEADIAKAIALSLESSKLSGGGGQSRQNGGSGGGKKGGGNYPSLDTSSSAGTGFGATAVINSNTPRQQQQQQSGNTLPFLFQVRAMYDFEAVEDNELSFATADTINVIDDRDTNWWRGCLASEQQRGGSHIFYGMFPVSFVEPIKQGQQERKSADSEQQKKGSIEIAPAEPPAKIDEAVLIKCMELLQCVDSSNPVEAEPPELARYERMAMAQAPLVDQQLFQIEKHLDMLAQVDVAIREVMSDYDQAMGKLPSQHDNNSPKPQQQTQAGANLPPNRENEQRNDPNQMVWDIPHQQQQQTQAGANPPPNRQPEQNDPNQMAWNIPHQQQQQTPPQQQQQFSSLQQFQQ